MQNKLMYENAVWSQNRAVCFCG